MSGGCLVPRRDALFDELSGVRCTPVFGKCIELSHRRVDYKRPHSNARLSRDEMLEMSQPKEVTEGSLNIVVRTVESCQVNSVFWGQLNADVAEAGPTQNRRAITARIIDRNIGEQIECSKLVGGSLGAAELGLAAKLRDEISERMNGFSFVVGSLDHAHGVGAPAPRIVVALDFGWIAGYCS